MNETNRITASIHMPFIGNHSSTLYTFILSFFRSPYALTNGIPSSFNQAPWRKPENTPDAIEAAAWTDRQTVSSLSLTPAHRLFIAHFTWMYVYPHLDRPFLTKQVSKNCCVYNKV